MATSAAVERLTLSGLNPGDTVKGFVVDTIYLDAADRPAGARFMHAASGHRLDLLAIDTVPQALAWVTTYPESNKGTPHTLEHLLAQRGCHGKERMLVRSMALATMKAFTMSTRTYYGFDTAAGIDAFFKLVEVHLRALMRPDFSDVEVHLEVYDFGVESNPDGSLRLEEKGQVYNEMLPAAGNAMRGMLIFAGEVLYGQGHPLGFDRGGTASGIRQITPGEIRRFHAQSYHLANMGTVATFPPSVPLSQMLERFDANLVDELRHAGPRRDPSALRTRPAPPARTCHVRDYPASNAAQLSPMRVAWPADRTLDPADHLLCELFLEAVADGPGAPLHQLLVDSHARVLDTGSTRLSAWVSEHAGHPIMVSLGKVRPDAMTEEGMRAVSKVVTGLFRRLATLPDGSDELKEFNARVAVEARLEERRRRLFLGRPPRFGARNQAGAWKDFLGRLDRCDGSRKSLVMKPEFDKVHELLAGPRNVWREALARWRVLDVEPYVLAMRPEPRLKREHDKQRDARVAEETRRLMDHYGVDDAQQAYARAKVDQEKTLASVANATRVPPVGLIENPPLTLDDDLRFESITLASGVTLVASRFDSMSGAMTGVALSADRVPAHLLRYLSLMPDLLRDVGIVDGHALSAGEVSLRLKNEIHSLTASFSANPRTGRTELVLKAQGSDLEESSLAIEWMAKMLRSPNWRADNLARLQDVVERQLQALRQTQQGKAESWTLLAGTMWNKRDDPVWLATHSFHTRAYNALRLRWQLMNPPEGDAEAVATFLAGLAEADGEMTRAALDALLMPEGAPGWAGLTAAQQQLAGKALRDLSRGLLDMPDTSLADDFAHLARTLAADLALPAATALERLEATRRALATGGARMFMASSQETGRKLFEQVDAFARPLGVVPPSVSAARQVSVVGARLRDRGVDDEPLHAGLHVPDMKNGVIVTTLPLATHRDWRDEDKVLDYLASRLYGGAGPHAAYVRTIAKGLAYSNNLRASLTRGDIGYYAEHTPRIPDTVRFVIDLVRNSPPDRGLVDYVMALAFNEDLRSSLDFEDRAECVAADIVDGSGPEVVRRFRSTLLALRRDPALIDKLYERKDTVHARILPGYDTSGDPSLRGGSFVIGPPSQIDAWRAHVRHAEGPQADVLTLYPRDFWMV